MSTYIIYALIALGVVLATLFIFKKYIPSEIDPFFVKSNRRERKNGLTFDPALSFFRLKQHYKERIKDKKVFKFSPKEMDKFKNLATTLLAKHIINVATTTGNGVSNILVKELSGYYKACHEDENEIFEVILQGLSGQTNLVNALRKELSEYEQHLKDSCIKENPDKIKEICINKLCFFFVNLRHSDVLDTKLFNLFESDFKRLRSVIDIRPHIPEQKSLQSS